MEKLKIGDYVRTKDGIIAKITDIIEDCIKIVNFLKSKGE